VRLTFWRRLKPRLPPTRPRHEPDVRKGELEAMGLSPPRGLGRTTEPVGESQYPLPSGGPSICFVSAPGSSAFMAELLEVLADAVCRSGGVATAFEGLVPSETGSTVFVVVPHEYYAVVPKSLQPNAQVRKRMIGLCVEQPGTQTFETVVERTRGFGAVVAISAEAVTELSRRGIRAERFVLGYSPLWDHWRGQEAERPVDVTYLGTLDSRRTRLVAGWAEALWPWRTQLLMPPHEPMTRPRSYFLMGEEKWRHLAGSKLLLNLHRQGAHGLEWVRVLEAICNGCVVVTERSVGCAPLAPGVHLAVGRPQNLGVVAATLLRHPERLAAIRTAAYETCRQELDMSASARRLVELAGGLPGPGGSLLAPLAIAAFPSRASAPMDEQIPITMPRPPVWGTSADSLHQAVGYVLCNERLAQRPSDDPSITEWQPVVENAAVDALVIGGAGDAKKSECVHSLARQTGGVVVGLRTAVDGVESHETADPGPPDFSSRQSFGGGWLEVRHRVPVGRGYLLNEALRTVRAPLTLVLHPEMRLFPPAVERLTAAVADTGAQAAFALVRLDRVALENALPPEPNRLARFPYLGAGFLILTEVLRQMGGFSDDPALEGLEDHDFWCRFAESGFVATLLPEVLVDRQSPRATQVRPVDLDPWSSWSALRRRSPDLHRRFLSDAGGPSRVARPTIHLG